MMDFDDAVRLSSVMAYYGEQIREFIAFDAKYGLWAESILPPATRLGEFVRKSMAEERERRPELSYALMMLELELRLADFDACLTMLRKEIKDDDSNCGW